MKAHFQQFASYNRWANAHLFAAALALPDEDYRRDLGLFFGSIHRTLNHLLYTDRMWMGRIDGSEQLNGPLDHVLHDDPIELARGRIAADDRLAALIDSRDEAGFDQEQHYRTTAGVALIQQFREILAHLFNHQTHHRSQANSGLSLLDGVKSPSLDLLLFQRGLTAPDLRHLVG